MTGRDDRTRWIQDFLDGYLTPDQEAGVRRRIREDADWRRDHESLGAVYALLDTPLDVEPPADLLDGIRTALAADAAHRAEARRLPARVENGLVLAGASALAAALVVASRALTFEGFLGRVVAGGAEAVTFSTRSLTGGLETAIRFDWVTRSLATLAEAGRTVLGTVAEPLLGVGLVAVALTAGLAWLVLRSGSSNPRGGWSHG